MLAPCAAAAVCVYVCVCVFVVSGPYAGGVGGSNTPPFGNSEAHRQNRQKLSGSQSWIIHT